MSPAGTVGYWNLHWQGVATLLFQYKQALKFVKPVSVWQLSWGISKCMQPLNCLLYQYVLVYCYTGL